MPAGEDIYVARADGSDVRKIMSAPLGGLATVGWTPTSDGLLVAHDVNSVQRLEVFDAAGKATPRLLAEGLAVAWAVYRPPTGDEIMIRGKVDGVWGLYAMGTDGSKIRLLAAAKQDGPPGQPGPQLSRLLARRDADLLQPIHARGRDDPGVGHERRRIRPAPLQPVRALVLLVGG